MITLVPEQIEHYAGGHSTPVSETLRELEAETYRKTSLPQMLVGHLEGAFLKMLVQISGARRVLEIGTFTGYSALAMAEGLAEDGQLITCEIDGKSAEIARRFWQKSPHGQKITLKMGPALETLSTLSEPFDFMFIDADKENYIAYWEACIPRLSPGGLLVADNVLWSGRVLNPKEASDKSIAAFNEHVNRDPRAEVLMLTVRDGMTLARKK